MNLHTIMNSFSPMETFKARLMAFMYSTDDPLTDLAISYLFKYPSMDCILINMSSFLTTFYDDNLMPKDAAVYDELCTAVMMNNTLNESFTYEEIQYSNRKTFFKDCTPDDLIAYTGILITEYLATKFDSADRQKIITFHPYSELAEAFQESEDLMYHLRDYAEGCSSGYPAAVMLITSNTEIIFENLRSIKDCLTVFKRDSMAANDKTLANMALDNLQGVAEDKIFYYNGKSIDTSKFKDSDSAFCRFLYHITRGTIELNSTGNIKAIFENLKEMVGIVSNRTLNEWLQKFIASSAEASNLVIAYLQRLAAKNNDAISEDARIATATFNYDGSTTLFEIAKAKNN